MSEAERGHTPRAERTMASEFPPAGGSDAAAQRRGRLICEPVMRWQTMRPVTHRSPSLMGLARHERKWDGLEIRPTFFRAGLISSLTRAETSPSRRGVPSSS
jgi:hypothetical protein